MAERSLRQRRKRGAVPKAQATARGVRGHAPPEKIEYLDANLCNLVHSGEIFNTCNKGTKWQLHIQKKVLNEEKNLIPYLKQA